MLDAAENAVKKRENPGTEIEVETSAPAEAAPAAGGPADDKDREIEQLKAQLEASMASGRDMMGRIKDGHEKMLRAVADLENFKKRARKEQEDTQKFGNEKLLKDFLPVLDNIDRALEPANSADVESLRKGVEMIRKLLEDTLGKHGVKAFSSKGKPFDPNFHEAMSQAETDQMPANHVHSEILRGFTLNERLVRPALVIVSKAAEKPSSEAPPAPGEGGTNG
ncbi:MAG: nucleotide exchange factor GrpE [Myxococcaceae bacterium]|nr:nucleotide exchange factor GrpE [Myxococcaceae bacterium]